MKVDRRFFDRTKETVKVSTSRENRGHRGADGTFRQRKTGLPRSELIKKTRCRKRNEKGHGARERPKRNGQSLSASATAGGITN
eukprot:2006637-Pyramimonas_sp.AAC.1